MRVKLVVKSYMCYEWHLVSPLAKPDPRWFKANGCRGCTFYRLCLAHAE